MIQDADSIGSKVPNFIELKPFERTQTEIDSSFGAGVYKNGKMEMTAQNRK